MTGNRTGFPYFTRLIKKTNKTMNCSLRSVKMWLGVVLFALAPLMMFAQGTSAKKELLIDTGKNQIGY